jgi:hypothetical protein
MVLEANNFFTEFSKGYIIPVWEPDAAYFDKILENCHYHDEFKRGSVISLWNYSPLFRRGVIRGIKKKCSSF